MNYSELNNYGGKTTATVVGGFTMPFIPSKIWKDARELLDPALGSVVDEFVNENYNSVVAMSDFYLGDPSRSMRSQTRNAILVRSAGDTIQFSVYYECYFVSVSESNQSRLPWLRSRGG